MPIITSLQVSGNINKLYLFNKCFNQIVVQCIDEDIDTYLNDEMIQMQSHLLHLKERKIVQNSYVQVLDEISEIKSSYPRMDYKKENRQQLYLNRIKMFSEYVGSIGNKYEFNYKRDVPLFDHHFASYKETYGLLYQKLAKAKVKD